MTISENRKAVIEQIVFAFSGVRLEDGLGLKEGQGVDDYKDTATCEQYRALDEKDDWRVISIEKLVECHSSLSFFDGKGMRFHIPAYIVAHLRDETALDPIFHLTNLDDYGRSKFVLLSKEQRRAIKAYLLEVLSDNNFKFDHEAIRKSLDTYWS